MKALLPTAGEGDHANVSLQPQRFDTLKIRKVL